MLHIAVKPTPIASIAKDPNTYILIVPTKRISLLLSRIVALIKRKRASQSLDYESIGANKVLFNYSVLELLFVVRSSDDFCDLLKAVLLLYSAPLPEGLSLCHTVML